jgi:hypothetical protein
LFTLVGACFSLHFLVKDYFVLALLVFLAGLGCGLVSASFFLKLLEKGFQ